jgi:monoamine oxidase
VPLDLGAEWIHHSNEQMVKDLIVFQDSIDQGLAPSEFIKYQPQWQVKSRQNKLLQMLYQETKWKRSTWWHWLEKYVYSHVQEKVELNTVVKEIIYNKNEGLAKVVLADGTFRLADKVICTIPLAVLKTDMITFSPPLPQKKIDAINAIRMPAGVRILFEMKEKFYPDANALNGLLEMIWSGGELTAVYDALYHKELANGQNIMAFIAIGNKLADELCELEDDDLAKAALAKIDEIYDGQGSKNYVKHTVQNWKADPYIQGVYTFEGKEKLRPELGKTVNGEVLFAGEHTSKKYFSLVPGAAIEGRRAAVEALTGLR